MHGAVVFETKRPRNIERFVTFKEMQKKEMYNLFHIIMEGTFIVNFHTECII